MASVVLIALPAFSAPPGSKGGAKNPFVELNGELVSVQGAVTSLQDQINMLVGRVESLEELAAASADAITKLQAQDVILQALIDQNITDIASIQNEILNLQQANVDLQAQIDANSGDIDSLQAQIDTNSNLITSLQSAIIEVEAGSITLGDSLQEQINNNANLIAILQEDILEVERLQAFKEKLVSGQCPNGEALISVQDDGSLVCEPVDGSVNGALYITNVYNWFGVPRYSSRSGHAICPSGYRVSGGGYETSKYITSVFYNKPSYVWGSGASWHVAAYNDRSWNIGVYVRAVCMKYVQQ
jgi:predicted  nucleic acid-binding Zn-ribbon protein